MSDKKRVYLDYAATTPVDPAVLEAMQPYFRTPGNSMSMHSFGRDASDALEKARSRIAGLMNAKPSEIIFTSSATEANNLMLKGTTFARRGEGKHIIISAVEHSCIMRTSEWLKTQGFEITVLPVDKYGAVDPASVQKALRKDTILVSVMHGNNEIGTIEPVAEIGKICADANVPFHTDAAQSFGKIPIDVKKMKIGALTASSQKMYGPLGISALYLREGIKIEPLLHGGGQEHGLRSSTSNVAGAVGFGKAVDIAKANMNEEAKLQSRLRDKLIENVLKIDDAHLNGHPTNRLPNNTNFWFEFIEGEALVMRLDAEGIAGSTGSACSSKSLEPSHVLLALGLKPEQAHGSLRLSLGRWTKEEDIDYVVEVLPGVVERLREISPFKKKWKA